MGVWPSTIFYVSNGSPFTAGKAKRLKDKVLKDVTPLLHAYTVNEERKALFRGDAEEIKRTTSKSTESPSAPEAVADSDSDSKSESEDDAGDTAAGESEEFPSSALSDSESEHCETQSSRRSRARGRVGVGRSSPCESLQQLPDPVLQRKGYPQLKVQPGKMRKKPPQWPSS